MDKYTVTIPWADGTITTIPGLTEPEAGRIIYHAMGIDNVLDCDMALGQPDDKTPLALRVIITEILMVDYQRSFEYEELLKDAAREADRREAKIHAQIQTLRDAAQASG